jgi:hypothetical protein
MRDKVRESRQAVRLMLGAGVVLTLAAISYVLLAGTDPIPWPTVLGLTGMVVGLLVMLTIRRSGPEPDAKNWRYRELPVPVRLACWMFGRRGRDIARAMIVLAGALIPIVLFYLVARPGFMGEPMFPTLLLGLEFDEVGLVVGLGGMAVGLAWMIRIYHRSYLEPEPTGWRYRDPALGPGNIAGRGWRWRWDGLTGKAVARNMIIFAVLLPFAVLVAWAAQPGWIGGGMLYEPRWYEVALPWAGAIGYLVGLGWMIRIYRADPEPHQPSWRYRD